MTDIHTDPNTLPASTAPLAAGLPLVQGRCPACGRASLFLGNGGHVTCSVIDCPNPSLADEQLHGEQPALAATEATQPGYCPACGRGDCAPTADQYGQLRADANEWRRKAISRALTISRLRGTIDALIDLAGEKITDPGPRGAGYREAIGDLREVLRVYGHLDREPAATEATRPANWLTAGTRDLSIPEQHRFTARPVDPEEERAASDRARRIADEAQRASEQLAALGGPHTGLVVEAYRNDQGQARWVFRCWGDDHCDGLVSLDHTSQRWAEVARDRHLAEDHKIVTSPAERHPESTEEQS